MAFTLTSPLFASGQAIPMRFTRDGENISPPLVWDDPPTGSRSFAILMEDPLIPRRYWLAWDITGSHLPEGAGVEGGPLRQAVNDFGRAAYDGPAPLSGETYHPYYFRLAALSVPALDMKGGADADAAWDRVKASCLGEVDLIGIYTRLDTTANPND